MQKKYNDIKTILSFEVKHAFSELKSSALRDFSLFTALSNFKSNKTQSQFISKKCRLHA